MGEWDEVDLVGKALYSLRCADPLWVKNHRIFVSMGDDQRRMWWRLAKKQADKGVLSMQTLLAEVIKLRMSL